MPPITSGFNFSSASADNSLEEPLFPYKYIVDAAGCPPGQLVLGPCVPLKPALFSVLVPSFPSLETVERWHWYLGVILGLGPHVQGDS